MSMIVLPKQKKRWSAFDVVVLLILAVMCMVFLYPFIYVVANSFSAAMPVVQRKVFFYPIGVNVDNYIRILSDEEILPSYVNTIFYSCVGTAYSMALTILAAYPLSRRNLPLRNFIMFLITFTMLFNAGLIPTFLVVKQLGLLNTIWAMILPCAVSQFNLIIMRTSFQQIPDALEEAAVIDGANDFTILTRIMLPMTIPILVTVALFYFSARWNDFYQALIYLTDEKLYPLQLVMRSLLLDTKNARFNYTMTRDGMQTSMFGFQCAVIVIAALPLVAVVPFVQRFFVKGVALGAVKG